MNPGRTRRITIAEIRTYMGKAEEFLEAAESECAAGRYVPTTSLAVHAAINAGDVVIGCLNSQRLAGQSHDTSVQALHTAGPDGRAVATNLGRLLPLKSRAEYQPVAITASQAATAMRNARAAVERARRVLADREGN